MKTNHTSLPFLLLALIPSFSIALAEESDDALPKPFNPAIAEPLLSAPPFTRAINLSDKLVLTGIAFIEGKPVATILDTEKKQNYVVSEEPNAQGWKLAETSANVKLDRTQVKIMVGGEVVTIRYSKDQLTPENTKNARPGESNRGGRGDDRGGDRSRFRRGPDDDTRRRLEALPEDARRRLFEEIGQNRERFRSMSEDERRQFFQRQLERTEQRVKEGR